MRFSFVFSCVFIASSMVNGMNISSNSSKEESLQLIRDYLTHAGYLDDFIRLAAPEEESESTPNEEIPSQQFDSFPDIQFSVDSNFDNILEKLADMYLVSGHPDSSCSYKCAQINVHNYKPSEEVIEELGNLSGSGINYVVFGIPHTITCARKINYASNVMDIYIKCVKQFRYELNYDYGFKIRVMKTDERTVVRDSDEYIRPNVNNTEMVSSFSRIFNQNITVFLSSDSENPEAPAE